MQLHEHNINDIVVIDDMAFVYFDVRYGGFLPDGGQLEVKGEGELEFVYSDDTWWISFLRFPGIVI
ncbi:MAG: hypothetical protein EOO04_37305 [Chitinophagaceae bacterium]|nr:MAG: hypothetical protein EOO04_37305 [Chitinophagaceae bacterium]